MCVIPSEALGPSEESPKREAQRARPGKNCGFLAAKPCAAACLYRASSRQRVYTTEDNCIYASRGARTPGWEGSKAKPVRPCGMDRSAKWSSPVLTRNCDPLTRKARTPAPVGFSMHLEERGWGNRRKTGDASKTNPLPPGGGF